MARGKQYVHQYRKEIKLFRKTERENLLYREKKNQQYSNQRCPFLDSSDQPVYRALEK